jgi:hypothetical protein
VSEHKHLFVAGPQRSGTTLLQLVLSAHPLITVTPEAQFITRLFAEDYAPEQPLNQTQKQVAIALMRDDQKLNSWPSFNLEDFLAIVPWQTDLTLRQLLDFLFRFFAKQTHSGTDYLGNKKSLYASKPHGRYTKRIFPDAKFIYIVRDPRDVTRSMLKNLAPSSLEKAARICQRRGRNIAEMMELFPDDVLIVRYEDLILTPEPVSRRICEFLSIPYEAQMLRFYELNSDGSRLIGVTKDIHPQTTTPFNPNLIGQWQKQACFTTQELQTIETITCNYMSQYGYEPGKFISGISP